MNKTHAQIREESRKIEDKWFDEWNALGGPESGKRPDWYYEDKIHDLYTEWRQSLEVGDRVHICCYSDIEPATVIKRTKSSVTVRYDDADLDPNWKPEFIPGGFSAICTNDSDQKWIIKEDLNGRTETFRWSKRYGRFKNTSNEFCEPEWYKYYDYNF
jgi:hypothetical protein